LDEAASTGYSNSCAWVRIAHRDARIRTLREMFNCPEIVLQSGIVEHKFRKKNNFGKMG
jgi:hypothetical protein